MKSKIKTEEEQQDQNSIYYLSSIDGDTQRKPIEFEMDDDQEPLCDKIKRLVYFIIAFLLYFVSYILIVVPYSVFSFLYQAIQSMRRFNCELFTSFLAFLFTVACCTSTFYVLINYFAFWNSKENLVFLYEDAIFFFFTTVLTLSYIKVIYVGQSSFSNILCNIVDERSINTMQYAGQELGSRYSYIFDYISDNQHIFPENEEYKQIYNISSGISLFKLKKQLPQMDGASIQLLNGFDFGFTINFKQFMIITLIVIIKLYFIFSYFYTHEPQITQSEVIDFSFISFFFLFTAFNLHRALSNTDLRRKEEIIKRLQRKICLDDFSQVLLEEKVDLTCPVSIEVWDNIRKFILELDQEHLSSIELSYFCLFLQFIFVFLIILSYYFDLNWIIDKESFLMKPTIIIMSTFNFAIFTCYLFFRLWQGGKYNDAIDDLHLAISNNIDVVEDIYTMFNQFFFLNGKKNKAEYNLTLRDRNSSQAIIAKKIKLLSQSYIENKEQYYGVIYDKSKKTILRKKIIKNVIISLKKIKQSIQNDTDQYKYKFLNLIEINFNDTLITFTIGIITFLPTIIPKFLDFYYPKKE